MLAIIGGTGIYELEGMAVDEQLDPTTPFGAASAPLRRGRIGGRDVLFLARHGSGHRLLPHEVNYRANIYALKREGATQVLGFSAVGSLAEAVAPGDLAVPTQYLDQTRGGRRQTFFGDGVVGHVSTAEPVSRRMVDWIAAAAAQQEVVLHRDLTYACVEGPRLGTRAESRYLQAAGCQLVGMTNVPEVFLAREAQLCYATIGIVTDYDCWMDDPSRHVTVGAIFERYRQSLADAARLLDALLAGPPPEAEAEIRTALGSAMLGGEEHWTPSQREWMAVLRR